MASSQDFRRIAMSFEGTREAPHFDRSAFKAARIYATLAADGRTANVKFAPEEQAFKSMMAPQAFAPVPNAWGRQGWTTIVLEAIDVSELRDALETAWRHATEKKDGKEEDKKEMYELGAAELIQRLSIALAIGLLIGLERGWTSRDESEGERAAGLRTHGLAGLLGGVWGAIVQPFGASGVVALAIAFAFVGALVGVYRYRENVHDETYGATTVVASSLAFSLGAFAVIGDIQAAAAAAVATTAILALKAFLHGLVKRITWDELRSGLALLAMSFILLPVLPNRAIDPWQAVNPFELWLMTVLIGVISFAGYIAVKIIGYRRGVAVAGMAGGLASSTAATAAMSRLAREYPSQIGASAAGAIFANAVMAPRIIAIIAVINPALAWRLAPPVVAAGVLFALAGVFLLRRSEQPTESRGYSVGNPLDLMAVLKFGALLASVMILSRLATHFAGNAGAYALAAISGAVDVDAIGLTMARLGATEIGIKAAAGAVLLALLSNTASKVVMGWVIGGAAMGYRLAAASALAVAGALAALWLAEFARL